MTAVKKQKGLGRGLDALLGDSPRARETGEAEARAARGRAVLPIEYLAPDPDQPRRHFNEDALEELATSIRSRGLLQPILVRPLGPNAYRIVAGERRWRAAQKARLHEVPVVVRELTDAEAAEIALIENVQRVDLNPLEEARAYQRLIDTYKRSHDEIARAVGKSRSHITNTLRLLSLSGEALEALGDGRITAGHARAILAAPKPEAVLHAVLKDGISVREAERLAAAAQQLAGGGSAKRGARAALEKKSVSGRKDADTRALEGDLSAALGLEVEIEHSRKGAGTVTIRYLDLDQLDDICRRLMGQAA